MYGEDVPEGAIEMNRITIIEYLNEDAKPTLDAYFDTADESAMDPGDRLRLLGFGQFLTYEHMMSLRYESAGDDEGDE